MRSKLPPQAPSTSLAGEYLDVFRYIHSLFIRFISPSYVYDFRFMVGFATTVLVSYHILASTVAAKLLSFSPPDDIPTLCLVLELICLFHSNALDPSAPHISVFGLNERFAGFSAAGLFSKFPNRVMQFGFQWVLLFVYGAGGLK
jgi:hypothetical protein